MSASTIRRMDRWMAAHHIEAMSPMAILCGPVPSAAPLLYLDPPSYFRERATRWIEETKFLSSPSQRAEHPAFREIVAMGRGALPFVLREFDQRPARWVIALQAINGEQPVAEPDFGDLARIREVWLHWAQQQGIAW